MSDTATDLPGPDALTTKQARILESYYALRQRLPGPSIGNHEIPSSVRSLASAASTLRKYTRLHNDDYMQ